MKRTYIILLVSIINFTAYEIASSQTTFNYTGGIQSYTVPACISSISVDVKGGEGGMAWPYYLYGVSGTPGLGGRTQATLQVTPGEVLTIYVGGKGNNATCYPCVLKKVI